MGIGIHSFDQRKIHSERKRECGIFTCLVFRILGGSLRDVFNDQIRANGKILDWGGVWPCFCVQLEQ